MRRFVRIAVLAACLIAGSSRAMAEEANDGTAYTRMAEAMKLAPRSPNGLPMEAVWDRAPGTADGNFQGIGPYFVSRWGDIVVRGRRNGDLVDRALAAKHCGAPDNPATDIVFIGEAPPNICEGVTVVAANKTISFDSPVTIRGRESTYEKFGTPHGWVVHEFVQNINGVVSGGLKPATGDAASDWGVSSLGAFYRNEGGKHVFYAPGETVKLTDSYSFTVEPIMDDDELAARASAAIMNDPALAKIGTESIERKPVPWAGLTIILGIPLLLIGGLLYGIRRWLRHRRGAVATPLGLHPDDVDSRVAQTSKADSAPASSPPTPHNGPDDGPAS